MSVKPDLEPPALLSLSAGNLNLDLCPAIGGGIARLNWRGVDIMRAATAQSIAAGDILGLASFPLVPFSGRIAAGQFQFDGQIITLPPFRGPHALHGQGWCHGWSVARQHHGFAHLIFDHEANAWPWAYRAEQTFELSPNALVHTLKVENRSGNPMPAGLGLHPYFPRREGLSLTAKVDGYSPNDARMLPTEVSPVPTAWDWTLGRQVVPTIDNQFTGWDGTAIIAWPDLTLRMTSDPTLRHLVVYAPAGEDYVCIEPVSHAIDAVNRSFDGSAGGMKVLAPGAQMAISVTFEILE